jgi:hypothetical protein
MFAKQELRAVQYDYLHCINDCATESVIMVGSASVASIWLMNAISHGCHNPVHIIVHVVYMTVNALGVHTSSCFLTTLYSTGFLSCILCTVFLSGLPQLCLPLLELGEPIGLAPADTALYCMDTYQQFCNSIR